MPGSVGFGCAGLAQILELKCEIDAVICSIDLLALGVFVEAQSRNLRILEDLAVMGFGDLDSAAHPHLADHRACRWRTHRPAGYSVLLERMGDTPIEGIGRRCGWSNAIQLNGTTAVGMHAKSIQGAHKPFTPPWPCTYGMINDLNIYESPINFTRTPKSRYH